MRKNILIGGALVALLGCQVIDKKTVKEVVDSVTVVLIETDKSLGTGFVVRVEPPDVYIMTAAHVVRGAEWFRFKFYRGFKFIGESTGARVEFFNDQADVAILKAEFDPTKVIPARLETRHNPETYDECVSIGFAAGMELVVTKGIVSSKTSSGRYFITSAPAFFGNSGGPVISLKTGRVIGMTLALLQAQQMFRKYVATHVHMFIGSKDIQALIG